MVPLVLLFEMAATDLAIMRSFCIFFFASRRAFNANSRCTRLASCCFAYLLYHKQHQQTTTKATQTNTSDRIEDICTNTKKENRERRKERKKEKKVRS